MRSALSRWSSSNFLRWEICIARVVQRAFALGKPRFDLGGLGALGHELLFHAGELGRLVGEFARLDLKLARSRTTSGRSSMSFSDLIWERIRLMVASASRVAAIFSLRACSSTNFRPFSSLRI